ncbi:MAG: serine/threonine-protein kinase [Thermoanaerobaculia bacterium]
MRLAGLHLEDPALACEVESLLVAASHAAHRFDLPAFELLPAMTAEAPAAGMASPEPLHGRIGPYRLVREIGRGGMGRVYLAEQEGEEFCRQVALKTIDRPSAATDDTIRRFREEVRILAGLEHPGIARFLDGGRSPDGVWFLALEYVEGEDLLGFVRSRALDVRRRIELLLQLLDAVDFAHRRLVVHRDLKPGNVLVGADGRAKLLDFGISKLLDTEAMSDVTQTGLRRMTPAYASPEQQRGERETVSTDVYSLGVILFELLTGKRPASLFGDSGEASPTARREPQLPSTTARRQPPAADTRIQPLAVPWRILAGDLDAITMKALRAEAEDRYPSAAAFADDLRRWLSGQPVLAHRGGRRYRMSKFVRRHRTALLAAMLSGLALAVGSAAALWQARIAGQERDNARVSAAQAQREAASAERIAEMLAGVFDSASPYEHPGPIDARELLEKGTAGLAGGLAAEPELKAQVAMHLTEVWLRLGDTKRAAALAEPAASDLERLRGVEDPLTARAWSTLAAVRRAQGRNPEAHRLLDRALAVQRRALGDRDRFTLRTLSRLGNLQRAEGDFAAGRQSLEAVIAGFELLGEGARGDLARAVGDLGLVLQRTEDWKGAESAHRRAHDLLVQLFGADSPRSAVSLVNLAEVLDAEGRDDEAREALEEVLRVNQKVFGSAGFPGESVARNSLAWLLLDAHQPAMAAAEFRRAMIAAERERGPGHSDLAWPMRGLAEAEIRVGHIDAARKLYERALDLRTRFWGRSHWEVAQSLEDLAHLAAREHDSVAEERFRREALAIRRAVQLPHHPDLARAVLALGELLCAHPGSAEGLALLAEGAGLASTASPPLPDEGAEATAASARCAAR